MRWGWSWARLPLTWSAGMILALALLVTTVGGAGNNGNAAGAARSAIEQTMQQAVAQGVPANDLAAIQRQLRQIDAQRGWFGLTDAQAAARYQSLANALPAVEAAATAAARDAAQTTLTALATALQRAAQRGSVPPSLTTQLQAAQHAFAALTTPADYDSLRAAATATLAAARALPATQDGLASFASTLAALQHAGLGDALANVALAQAQLDFARAASAGDLTTLQFTLRAAMVMLANDRTQAIPFAGAAILRAWQARLTLLQSFGQNIGGYQGALTAAWAALPQVTTAAQFAAFQEQALSQNAALDLPLARGQAQHDIATLQSLLDYCTTRSFMDYEYASGAVGIGNSQQDFANAVTQSDFQAVDDETNILIVNLRAMIANLSDATPYSQPHAADLSLLQYYHFMTGKVIVVSLREQALRAYQDGKLVMSMEITSGRPELPSPPGVTTVTERLSPTVFTSGEPPGSPFWYAPTTINYALLYRDGGYFIHDAWWRLQFGPGSNLPHYDPEAFNGGSHGCVNVPLQPMAQLYAWTPLGTPVIVY